MTEHAILPAEEVQELGAATEPAATESGLADIVGGEKGSAAAEEEVLPRLRVRITYQRGEAVKFISHQDETRMWERTLRRADLPLLYKQGFNPQPHIQIASPLGVGFTGLAELIDITFSPRLSLDELEARLGAALPPGFGVVGIEEVELKAPSLQGMLIGADYTILIYAEPDELAGSELETAIRSFWKTETIWRERERKGQKYLYNLRPLVLEMDYLGYVEAREEHRIHLRVQQRPGATGRPDEVVDALGFNRFARTLQRDRLYFSDRAEDVVVFARYPVISQEAITPEDAVRRMPRRKRRGRGPSKVETGPKTATGNVRSLSERAGDEFG